MYCEGTVIGETVEGYDIFVQYDKYTKTFTYTAAEYDSDGNMTAVYGLYPTTDGGFTYQSGKPVEIVSGC